MVTPSVPDFKLPAGQQPLARAQIEATLVSWLYEPSQDAVVPYNPGEAPAEGPERSCAPKMGALNPYTFAPPRGVPHVG